MLRNDYPQAHVKKFSKFNMHEKPSSTPITETNVKEVVDVM
jgi:hypothetical protein